MLLDFGSETRRINAIINKGASTRLTDIQFLEKEIRKWKKSPVRRDMIVAEQYYRGEQDILRKGRQVIGEDGKLEDVVNLPNNRLIDNQYQKIVDQKKNYITSKPINITTQNENYTKELKYILDKKFSRVLKNVAKDAINGGIGYLHPYYNENGEICFKRFNNWEIIPFWKDEEHTELDFFGRLYVVEGYEGEQETTFEYFEVYTREGMQRYLVQQGKLILDVTQEQTSHYYHVENGIVKGYNWQKIPLIAFKRNEEELPLIKCCKSLQDGINRMLSTFQNNMEEDNRNTILVLVNYDGANLGEFRRNLSEYGAVKVRSDSSEGGGDVRTLSVEVNAENYKIILELFKQAMIENCKSYDAKDARLTGDANQMHIQTIYQDIELDAQDMETEFQAAFEDLLWFIDIHLNNTGVGDFTKEEVEFTFNRNTLVNESELIENCNKMVGLLPTKLILEHHPWVKDVDETMKLLEEEKQKDLEEYPQFEKGDISEQEE